MLRVVATTTARRAVAAPSAGAHRTKIATAAIRAANEKKKGLSKRKDEGSVRDVFAPFKEAITATSPATSGDAEAAERVAALREGEAERDARRAEYSRRRMAEHHRVNGQLSRQIVLREAAILALPPQLRAEATEPDFESYPVRAARAPRRAILCTTLSGAHTARRSHRSRPSSRPQVQRRVFTDTPPIERYQEKLVARDDLDDGG